MSEIASTVFDLVYPSPATLKELSAIAISVQLWRQEIDKYRKNGTCFYELKSDIATLKDAIPNLPSSLFSFIEQYVKTLGSSIFSWKFDHSFSRTSVYEIFLNKIPHQHENEILSVFDDFVGDYDGSLNYVRTAKKMMICDRLSNDRKFKIACMYCFEDDIKRIWPSVSDEMDLDKINFNENPLLYYWICYLKNELSKISVFPLGISVEESMLEKCKGNNWSSVAYFWNRLNFEIQRKIAKKMIDVCYANGFNAAIFARYLFPKLDELLVDELIAEEGDKIIESLFHLGENENKYVIPVWMYIKNRINESHFIKIIERFLERECYVHVHNDSEHYKTTALYIEIWKTASDYLKQSVIQNFILKDEEVEMREDTAPDRDFTFLTTILSYASLEERNLFWRKKWSDLIVGAKSTNLNLLMNLCFEHDNDISEFKRAVMSKYENISSHCVQLLEDNRLAQINEFLNFCCVDIQTERNLKQQLLESNFLGEGSILKSYHLCRKYSLTDFINDAYGGADDLAVDFKSRLFKTPATAECLQRSVRSGCFSDALKLLTMSNFSQPVAAMVRNTFLNALKRGLIECSIPSYSAESLQKILLLCLGSEEKVTEFKKILPVEEIFRNMVQQEELKPLKKIVHFDELFGMVSTDENSSTEENQADILVRRYPHNLDQFLNWYFDTPEDIDEFKRKFSDVFATFVQRDNKLDNLLMAF